MRLCFVGSLISCAALLVLLSGWYASPAAGQTDSRPQAAERLREAELNPRFNVDTTLVLIPATVTDSSNRFVLGLQKEDFHLFEDGAEQTIAHFSGEDVPLSVGLVFDTSGSMDSKLRTSRQAALQFLKTMNPQDEAFSSSSAIGRTGGRVHEPCRANSRKADVGATGWPYGDARCRRDGAARNEESEEPPENDLDYF